MCPTYQPIHPLVSSHCTLPHFFSILVHQCFPQNGFPAVVCYALNLGITWEFNYCAFYLLFQVSNCEFEQDNIIEVPEVALAQLPLTRPCTLMWHS